jgi:type II secretory pathway component PulF
MVAFILDGSTEIKAGVGLFTFIAIHAAAYVQLMLTANSRAAKVEEVLPDFLSLMASNIRAGLTSDRALIVSAREEFGPLTAAIHNAGKNSITGMPLEQVMVQMGDYIKSDVLHKTVRLIVEGMQSGGDMSELLEKTALDIRKFRSVRKEVNSIIMNYKLFIMAAITFGAPLLYGVSTFLVDIMLKIKGKISQNTSEDTAAMLSNSVGVFKGKLLLTPEAIALFASVSILVTIFFGCMAVGIMTSGKRVEGLKYFPILSVVGISILFGLRYALSVILGGMMGGV